MKQFKKKPKHQLEKFSTIFTQLGLVLVLFVVFISLEYKTEVKTFTMQVSEEGEDIFDFSNDIPIIRKEPIKTKTSVRRELPQSNILDDYDRLDENEEEVETIITDEPIDEEIDNDFTSTFNEADEDEEIDKNDDPVGINFVKKIPVFKGCENLSDEKARKCLDKKMSKLVRRHFNTNLASDLGLKSGRHTIRTQFVINKEGKVTEIKVGRVHEKLQKEAKRVIDKIPEFTPGENNGKKVKVRYTLPINFMVE